MLLTIGAYTVALIHEPANDSFTIVDSHARDENGYPQVDGTAMAITFENLTELQGYLIDVYTGEP